MSNLPKMSNRAKLALEVLADGGLFVNRLERNSYTGREQFHMRLQRSAGWGSVVPGVGNATFHELRSLHLLERAAGGTSVTEPYKLRRA